MSPGASLPPLRVEQALRLLPDVDALAPLRALLVSTSRGRLSAEPHATVGKRAVQPSELRQLVPRAIERATGHLAALYDAAAVALDAEQRGDQAAAVRALLRAGAREEGVGRRAQARAWFDHALRMAEGLHDRRPEIETLIHLASLDAAQGHLSKAARFYQRSFTLADAELDQAGAAQASQGLGEVHLAQGQWQGAAVWLQRGLRYTDTEPARAGHLHLGLAELARLRGNLEDVAEHLRQARTRFEDADDTEGVARVLDAWGRLDALRGRSQDAVAAFREALARLKRAGGEGRLEMQIRMNIAELYLNEGRLPDAEDELRRTEEVAIEGNAVEALARVYVLIGRVHGQRGDEAGFVFFEKAIELSRGAEPSPRLEADVYVAYARFCGGLGEHEEAQAYLGRAREILETLGDENTLAAVDVELAQMPAS